jgi:hypothetical protein
MNIGAVAMRILYVDTKIQGVGRTICRECESAKISPSVKSRIPILGAFSQLGKQMVTDFLPLKYIDLQSLSSLQ